MKRIERKTNKRGLIGIVLFFVALFLILIMAFIMAIVVGVGGWASELVTPIMTGIGTAGNTNISEAAEATFTPLNTTVQALPWVLGFTFVVALLFSIGFGASYTFRPSPMLMGVYFMLIILLIFGAIVMNNMYEELYNSNDEIGVALQEQTLTSYMILYSPFILTLIAFITGIYMFTRPSDAGGGFGI